MPHDRQHYANRLRHVADDLDRMKAGAPCGHTSLYPPELRAIAAALSAPTWLPIPPDPVPGVAPWDGRHVIISSHQGWAALAAWRTELHDGPGFSVIETLDTWEQSHALFLADPVPTHYAPLPPPPAREDGR